MKTGIDLGTTFSLIAALKSDGQPQLLPDNTFKDLYSTPSAIHISKESSVVGYMVETMMEENPELPVVRFFKRNNGEKKPIYFDKEGRGWLPETLGALVLKKVKIDVEAFLGKSVSGSVITVPAHFNDVQRKAVKNAASMADLPLLGLVEEPVAAALHYGLNSGEKDEVILVYDLGGGTFDVSILTMDETGVYVLAKDGITNLGGKEFDEAIGAMILHQYKVIYGKDLNLTAIDSLQLRRISEEVKIELSQPNKPILKKMILIGSQAFQININKRDFDLAIREMIEKTIQITFQCIDAAGLQESHIDALMLVGGSSMIPYVKERMKKIFSLPNQRIFFHEPMRAVAYGAALHAAQLSGGAETYKIPPEYRGVTGHHIGIKTKNSLNGKVKIDCLIKKNMPLPIKAQRTYYTSSASQRKIKLQVVQYLSESEEDVLIGELVIGPIENPQVNYPIEVTVENLLDGTVQIEAFDPNTGVELNKTFGEDTQVGSTTLPQQKMLIRDAVINML